MSVLLILILILFELKASILVKINCADWIDQSFIINWIVEHDILYHNGFLYGLIGDTYVRVL